MCVCVFESKGKRFGGYLSVLPQVWQTKNVHFCGYPRDIFLFPDDPYNGTVTDSLLPIQRGFDITCKDVHLVHVHAGH